MPDVRPSIPRTPAQHTLRVVSILMAVLGVSLTLMGVFVTVLSVLADDAAALSLGASVLAGRAVAVGFGITVIAAGALVTVTAVLGLRAARDSSRVGPYRFLCYLVGLVTLVAVVWGWGAGTILVFNPVVLFTTVVYVLVCSSLADKVQREHDEGVRGTSYLLGRHQRTLSVLVTVMVVSAVGQAVVSVVTYLVLGSHDPDALLAMVGQVGARAGDVGTQALVGGLVTAAFDLGVALLGMRGANEPAKIVPFLVVASLGLVADVAQVVFGVARDGLAGVQVDQVNDMLWMGACAYLAWRIHRQPPVGGPVAE